ASRLHSRRCRPLRSVLQKILHRAELAGGVRVGKNSDLRDKAGQGRIAAAVEGVGIRPAAEKIAQRVDVSVCRFPAERMFGGRRLCQASAARGERDEQRSRSDNPFDPPPHGGPPSPQPTLPQYSTLQGGNVNSPADIAVSGFVDFTIPRRTLALPRTERAA